MAPAQPESVSVRRRELLQAIPYRAVGGQHGVEQRVRSDPLTEVPAPPMLDCFPLSLMPSTKRFPFLLGHASESGLVGGDVGGDVARRARLDEQRVEPCSRGWFCRPQSVPRAVALSPSVTPIRSGVSRLRGSRKHGSDSRTGFGSQASQFAIGFGGIALARDHSVTGSESAG